MKTESFMGHDIGLYEHNGECVWVLEDICNALEPDCYFPLNKDDIVLVEDNGTMVRCVTELGLYQLLLRSNCKTSLKFQRWSTTVMKKLRTAVGLKDYEAVRMIDADIQKDIDHILETLYYDETTGKIMQSVTVQGGDVEQVEFEG